MASSPICEYRRCGGRGLRETRLRWKARVLLTIDRRRWHVCEHCADLLTRQAVAEGLEVSRKRLGPDRAAQTEPHPKPKGKQTRKGRGKGGGPWLGKESSRADNLRLAQVIDHRKKGRTGRPTLEDLEAERRELERKKVGRMPRPGIRKGEGS